ncbi:MAG TPA: BolA family transcriptional regulator [Deltaproteobacteria bacterium]|nr:BolA family transcriptional regulator [Deltaproteobacteria bacterium]HCP48519.1 BolA family transcriptional regulator [Deltaproteobacteria bacterium]
MNHPSRLSAESTTEAIKERIRAALPESVVEVSGQGGHFTISVVSNQFEGLAILKKQRLVYSAIKDLMAGDDAPVHAVDRLVTLTPGESGT